MFLEGLVARKQDVECPRILISNYLCDCSLALSGATLCLLGCDLNSGAAMSPFICWHLSQQKLARGKRLTLFARKRWFPTFLFFQISKLFSQAASCLASFSSSLLLSSWGRKVNSHRVSSSLSPLNEESNHSCSKILQGQPRIDIQLIGNRPEITKWFSWSREVVIVIFKNRTAPWWQPSQIKWM